MKVKLLLVGVLLVSCSKSSSHKDGVGSVNASSISKTFDDNFSVEIEAPAAGKPQPYVLSGTSGEYGILFPADSLPPGEKVIVQIGALAVSQFSTELGLSEAPQALSESLIVRPKTEGIVPASPLTINLPLPSGLKLADSEVSVLALQLTPEECQ